MTTKEQALAFLQAWESDDWWVDIEDDVTREACRKLDHERKKTIALIQTKIVEDGIDDIPLDEGREGPAWFVD